MGSIMRYCFLHGLVALAALAFVGCDRSSPAESTSDHAAADTATPAPNQDTEWFSRNSDLPLLHFRVRLWGEAVGERIADDGTITHVKTYLAETPTVADFFIEPGAERIAIADLGNGKRIALYLKNLRVVNNVAEADVYGVRCNFGLRGPLTGRAGPGSLMHRQGTTQSPIPTRFVAGEPIERAMMQYSFGDHRAPMGADYSVRMGQRFTIALVSVTQLSEVMKDDPALDNSVPAEVEEEARRDMGPTTRPAASQPAAQ